MPSRSSKISRRSRRLSSLSVASAQAGAQLNRAAADAGITLNAISFAQDSLEDIFLAMTGDSDADLAQDRAQVVAR